MQCQCVQTPALIAKVHFLLLKNLALPALHYTEQERKYPERCPSVREWESKCKESRGWADQQEMFNIPCSPQRAGQGKGMSGWDEAHATDIFQVLFSGAYLVT